jgi:hypothetical protein
MEVSWLWVNLRNERRRRLKGNMEKLPILLNTFIQGVIYFSYFGPL